MGCTARGYSPHGTLRFPTWATLYTGGPVAEGVCTLDPGYTVQTPLRTAPPVRKAPPPSPGHCTNPLDYCPSSAQSPAMYTAGHVSAGVCAPAARAACFCSMELPSHVATSPRPSPQHDTGDRARPARRCRTVPSSAGGCGREHNAVQDLGGRGAVGGGAVAELAGGVVPPRAEGSVGLDRGGV